MQIRWFIMRVFCVCLEVETLCEEKYKVQLPETWLEYILDLCANDPAAAVKQLIEKSGNNLLRLENCEDFANPDGTCPLPAGKFHQHQEELVLHFFFIAKRLIPAGLDKF